MVHLLCTWSGLNLKIPLACRPPSMVPALHSPAFLVLLPSWHLSLGVQQDLSIVCANLSSLPLSLASIFLPCFLQLRRYSVFQVVQSKILKSFSIVLFHSPCPVLQPILPGSSSKIDLEPCCFPPSQQLSAPQYPAKFLQNLFTVLCFSLVYCLFHTRSGHSKFSVRFSSHSEKKKNPELSEGLPSPAWPASYFHNHL